MELENKAAEARLRKRIDVLENQVKELKEQREITPHT
jgi:hypothetical protein